MLNALVDVDIAGHRHRGRCRRHRHSGILYLSRVPEDSGAGLVSLSRYRTASGIGILVHSGTGLTRSRTVWHSGIINNFL